MREIKFRAWNKDGRYWLTDPTSPWGGINSAIHHIQDNYELMQYTGLKDKNGVEIYEGDIVKFSSHFRGDHTIPERIEVIEWDTVGYTDNLWIGYQDSPEWCEVIGNIYESPELLNKGSE